ncbi:tumor necrosis factor receptor superfamily member 1B-like [Branchiostoma lanceolatum]|uniref:tumor necrosis factor receptor superfamily member 1B-like n=1 Tax=Branchiostoma lanceolatum TaxID=7740 RepID=UPI003457252D
MRKRLGASSSVFNLTMLVILIFLVINIVPAKCLTTHATPNIECRGHSRKYKTLDPDGNPVCVPCSSCSPGYGVLRPCTEYQDTVCEACEPGKTFSGTDSTWRRCESCVKCATHELRRRECTPTRNGRCGSCETGWFHNDITGDCDVCSWCYPEYPAITDFVSACNVTGVTPGFQCAPILDAPYPPPLHVTTETSHRTVEALDHHHLIGYVGEEDHSLGANEELEKSTHCTPTESPSFAKDITTQHLIDSVRMLTRQASLAPQASNRRLSGQFGEDHKITGPSAFHVGAIVGIAVAVSTLMIIILVYSIKRRARACLLEGNESLIELPMSESPTDKTPLVENHDDVAFQNIISTII